MRETWRSVWRSWNRWSMSSASTPTSLRIRGRMANRLDRTHHQLCKFAPTSRTRVGPIWPVCISPSTIETACLRMHGHRATPRCRDGPAHRLLPWSGHITILVSLCQPVYILDHLFDILRGHAFLGLIQAGVYPQNLGEHMLEDSLVMCQIQKLETMDVEISERLAPFGLESVAVQVAGYTVNGPHGCDVRSHRERRHQRRLGRVVRAAETTSRKRSIPVIVLRIEPEER